MHSVKETARKFTCPTESDEMNLKRFVRYLKGVPSAKCLIEIVTPPKFVNVVHRQRFSKPSNNVQEHKRRSCAMEKRNAHSMVTNTANSEPEFRWSRIIRPDDWNCRRNGDETSLARIGT